MRDESSSKFLFCWIEWDIQMVEIFKSLFTVKHGFYQNKPTPTRGGKESDKRVRSIINTDWRLIAEFLCSLLQITIFYLFFLHYLIIAYYINN